MVVVFNGMYFGECLEMKEDFVYQFWGCCCWGLQGFFLLSVYKSVPHMKNFLFPNSFSTQMRNADLGGPLYAQKGTSTFPEAPLTLGDPAPTSTEHSTS